MQTAAKSEQGEDIGLTAALAADAANLKYEDLSADAVTVAKQCLMDWLGVTIAGAKEPLTEILRAEIEEQGGAPQASLIGGAKTSLVQAALVNGAASHALDYD
ncbi:MAG: MmgE/PrpD family protein, partial [Minwuiales bacterium]|nr:MmgE/PrpD family protein [Minwuiales bacterium]